MAALLVILGMTILVGVIWVRGFASAADQLAAAAVAIGAGTFALALVAAALAAIAYAQSVRRPRLGVKVALLFDAPTDLVTGERPPQRRIKSWRLTDPASNGVWADAVYVGPSHLVILIENTGDATARNVTVTVTIDRLQSLQGATTLPSRWVWLNNDFEAGWIRLQWDGGADIAVHPPPVTSRPLENVVLGMGWARAKEHVAVSATVASDNSPPATDVVTMVVDEPLDD